MGKKLLSLLLTFMMVITILPTMSRTVLADDNSETLDLYTVTGDKKTITTFSGTNVDAKGYPWDHDGWYFTRNHAIRFDAKNGKKIVRVDLVKGDGDGRLDHVITKPKGNLSFANNTVTYVYGAGTSTVGFTYDTDNWNYQFKKAVVYYYVDVTGVTLDPTSATLTAGDDPVTLTATVAPDNATNKTVNWTTSDPGVATVNNSGVVTAVAPGTATITATATNGTADATDDKIASCAVTVKEPVTEWHKDDEINLNGKYFYWNNSDLSEEGKRLGANETSKVPEPKYLSDYNTWVFNNFVSVKDGDSSYKTSIWPSIPTDKSSSDVPIGFRVKSGDGSATNPYTFEFVYDDHEEPVTEWRIGDSAIFGGKTVVWDDKGIYIISCIDYETIVPTPSFQEQTLQWKFDDVLKNTNGLTESLWITCPTGKLPKDFDNPTPEETPIGFKVNDGDGSSEHAYLFELVYNTPVETYPLLVGGTQVTNKNATNITGSETAVASYNAKTNTLTLNGASINTIDSGKKGISYDGEGTLNIVLTGNNTIKNENTPYEHGIFTSNGSINISGTGSLEVSGSEYGIFSAQGLTISGVALTATGNADDGIFATADLTISGDNTRVIATGAKVGIESSNGDIDIKGGTVNATATGANGAGIYVVDGHKTIISGQNTIVTAIGPGGAFEGNVANAMAGTGWKDTEGTQEEKPIATSTSGQDLSSYQRVEFPAGLVPYLDAQGKQQYCSNYTVVTSSDTTLTSGWYVVKGNVKINNDKYNHLVISGDVNLILCDDANLIIDSEYDAIFVEEGSLKIYAQSVGNTMGQLNATGKYDGININSGSITINGGDINLEAKDYYSIQSNGDVTINGGDLNLNGKTGIRTANNSNLTINGGNIKADSESVNFGIRAMSGDVTINDGNISLKGIYYGVVMEKVDSNFTINGGNITSRGGTSGISASGSVIINGEGSLIAEGTGNYGVDCSDHESGNVRIVGGNLISSGPKGAIAGKVINAMAGTGWTDTEGTEGKTKIDPNESVHTLSKELKKVQFPGVEPIAVTDISISETASVTVGEKATLTAEITPNNAADKTVKWSVNNSNVELYSDEACTQEVGIEATDILTVYAKGVKGGSATVTVTSNSVSTVSATCTVTVNKKMQTVEAPVAKQNLVYNDQNQYLLSQRATVTVGNTAGVRYKIGEAGGWFDSIPTGKNAGTYDVYYKVLGNDEYEEYTVTDPITISIAKGDNPTRITNTATVTRGGSTIDLSDNVRLNGATGTVSYAISGETNGCTLNGSILKSGDTTGTVTVNVSVAEDDNYNALPATPITVTITGKQAQTITAEDITVTYDQEGITVSATTDGNGKITYAIAPGSGDYIGIMIDTGKLSIIKVPADNKAYVVVTASETAEYSKATKEVLITINKADSSLTKAPQAKKNLKYTGSAQDLISEGEASGGTLYYCIGLDDKTPTAFDTKIPQVKDIGTYYVFYHIRGDENHKDTDILGPIEVSISKADPKGEITKENYPTSNEPLVYNGNNQTLLNNPTKYPVGYYTILYSTDGGNTWSNKAEAIDAGIHQIKFKFVSPDYEDLYDPSITMGVEIKKVTGSITSDEQKPVPKEDLKYSDTPIDLITAPMSLPEGYTKVQYSLDNGETWTDSIPKGQGGDYTIKVRYIGDNNHNDFIGDYDLKVTIQNSYTGNDTSWTKGSATDDLIIFKAKVQDEQTYDKFIGIKIDNDTNYLDPSKYSKSRGSIRINLKSNYLETLSIGKHTITAYFTDKGTSTSYFTINERRKPTTPEYVAPKTGIE